MALQPFSPCPTIFASCFSSASSTRTTLDWSPSSSMTGIPYTFNIVHESDSHIHLKNLELQDLDYDYKFWKKVTNLNGSDR